MNKKIIGTLAAAALLSYNIHAANAGVNVNPGPDPDLPAHVDYFSLPLEKIIQDAQELIALEKFEDAKEKLSDAGYNFMHKKERFSNKLLTEYANTMNNLGESYFNYAKEFLDENSNCLTIEDFRQVDNYILNSIEILEDTITILDDIKSNDKKLYSKTFNTLGLAYQYIDENDMATSAYKKSIRIDDSIDNPARELLKNFKHNVK